MRWGVPLREEAVVGRAAGHCPRLRAGSDAVRRTRQGTLSGVGAQRPESADLVHRKRQPAWRPPGAVCLRAAGCGERWISWCH